MSLNTVTSSRSAQSIGSGTSYTPEVIEFTPQRRSRSRSSRSKDGTAKLENAPQKSVRTQSKQYVIRKSDENSGRAHAREGRGRSTSKPRGQERGSNASTRSNSRPRGNDNNLPRHPRRRSISSYSHQNRARSVSQTRSVRSARSTRSGASSLGTMEIEPNVHHNAILTTAIECPVIAEMKENELFARKNGINL